MLKKRAVKIISVAIAAFVLFTVYQVATYPISLETEPKQFQQGYFGYSPEISNRTMNISAYGNSMELGFSDNGPLVPYSQAPSNSSLSGKYYLNTSEAHGLTSSTILSVVRLNASLKSPFTGMTIKIVQPSFDVSDPYFIIPARSVYAEATPGDNNSHDSSGALVWALINWGNDVPVNKTVQIWVNFTIIPIAMIGPYHIDGSGTPVSVTWNITLVSVAPKP